MGGGDEGPGRQGTDRTLRQGKGLKGEGQGQGSVGEGDDLGARGEPGGETRLELQNQRTEVGVPAGRIDSLEIGGEVGCPGHGG